MSAAGVFALGLSHCCSFAVFFFFGHNQTSLALMTTFKVNRELLRSCFKAFMKCQLVDRSFMLYQEREIDSMEKQKTKQCDLQSPKFGVQV